MATPDLRQQRLAGWVLVGTVLAVFGPGVVATLRDGGSAPAPASWQDRVASVEWSVFAVLIVIVAVRTLARHAPDALPALGIRRTPHLVAGTAAYVAAASVSTWLATGLAARLHLPVGTPTPLGHGAGALVTGTAASVSAAITEEVVLVALAAAVLARRGPAVTLGVLITLRWLVHVQYLGDSVFVLVWVPAAYLVFRVTGSIWPLVAGHASYDILLVLGHAYPHLGRWTTGALLVTTVAGLGVVLVTAAARGDDRRHERAAA